MDTISKRHDLRYLESLTLDQLIDHLKTLREQWGKDLLIEAMEAKAWDDYKRATGKEPGQDLLELMEECQKDKTER